MTTRFRALPALLLVSALSGAACVATTPATGESETHMSNVESARLEGTVTWGGAGVGRSVVLRMAGSPDVRTDDAGHYVMHPVFTGTPQITLMSANCGTVIGTTSQAGSSTLDIDITDLVGRVTATVFINGAPAPFAARLGVTGCSAFVADANGIVTAFLPPGEHSGRAMSPTTILGDVAFTAVAGQATELGILDYPAGSVRGGVSWNGAPILATDNVNVGAEPWSVSVSANGGQYLAEFLAPGNYDLWAAAENCGRLLGHANVTVTANATASADFDLTGTAGRLAAVVTAGGAPLASAQLFFHDIDCGAFVAGEDGALNNLLLPAGTYQASFSGPPRGPTGSATRSFSVTIPAAGIVDLGTVELLAPAEVGTLAGTVFWNGAPLAAPDFVAVDGGPAPLTTDATGRYATGEISAGTYTLTARSPECGTAFAQTSTVVADASDTTADFDLTATAGRITGLVTSNGAPLAFPTIRICNTPVLGDAAGRFSQLLPPGTYDADIVAPSNLGAITFTVLAGQTTDIDVVATPAGMNVNVDLGFGDVDGVKVDFPELTSGGTTTVVASTDGPPPPTGYEIYPFGTARYWDLETTAACDPATGACDELIRICIHYDPSLVVGNESSLVLRHYNETATAWDNITDGTPGNGTICGLTSKLSPFAIMMPIAVADTDPPVWGDVPDPVGAFATSTAGAIVNYTLPTAVDAVDGPVAVSCSPGPGSQFPINKTPVTCTATDAGGNGTIKSFNVWVTYEAPTDGAFFIRPIRADGSSRFKIGRAVPVKFRLAGASAAITDLRATLVVTKLSGAVRGVNDDECDEDGEDADFTFRYRPAKNLYGYRWKTRGETQGTYRLSAELGDGVVHEVNVSLKEPR